LGEVENTAREKASEEEGNNGSTQIARPLLRKALPLLHRSNSREIGRLSSGSLYPLLREGSRFFPFAKEHRRVGSRAARLCRAPEMCNVASRALCHSPRQHDKPLLQLASVRYSAALLASSARPLQRSLRAYPARIDYGAPQRVVTGPDNIVITDRGPRGHKKATNPALKTNF